MRLANHKAFRSAEESTPARIEHYESVGRLGDHGEHDATLAMRVIEGRETRREGACSQRCCMCRWKLKKTFPTMLARTEQIDARRADWPGHL